MITSKMLDEIRRRNLAGENDGEIARAIGSYPQEVRYVRKVLLNLEPNLPKLTVYRVYDNDTGDLIVRGTSRECAEALGIKYQSFLHNVYLSKFGLVKAKKIVKEEEE